MKIFETRPTYLLWADAMKEAFKAIIAEKLSQIA